MTTNDPSTTTPLSTFIRFFGPASGEKNRGFVLQTITFNGFPSVSESTTTIRDDKTGKDLELPTAIISDLKSAYDPSDSVSTVKLIGVTKKEVFNILGETKSLLDVCATQKSRLGAQIPVLTKKL